MSKIDEELTLIKKWYAGNSLVNTLIKNDVKFLLEEIEARDRALGKMHASLVSWRRLYQKRSPEQWVEAARDELKGEKCKA